MKSYWYKGDWSDSYGNIGDIISPLINEFITGQSQEYTPEGGGRLLGCGSILEFIQDGDILCGCGLIQDMELPKRENVKIIGVRGELSKQALNKAGFDVSDCLLFDPAIFTPFIFYKQDLSKFLDLEQRVATIWHYIEKNKRSDLPIINHAAVFINGLGFYGRVKTNSLHAYIIAEAYGLKAELLPLHPDIIGGMFKYNDYYSVVKYTNEEKRELLETIRKRINNE